MITIIYYSIEFDRDDELFATAGVSRRIKVFEFSTVRYFLHRFFYYWIWMNIESILFYGGPFHIGGSMLWYPDCCKPMSVNVDEDVPNCAAYLRILAIEALLFSKPLLIISSKQSIFYWLMDVWDLLIMNTFGYLSPCRMDLLSNGFVPYTIGACMEWIIRHCMSWF